MQDPYKLGHECARAFIKTHDSGKLKRQTRALAEAITLRVILLEGQVPSVADIHSYVERIETLNTDRHSGNRFSYAGRHWRDPAVHPTTLYKMSDGGELRLETSGTQKANFYVDWPGKPNRLADSLRERLIETIETESPGGKWHYSLLSQDAEHVRFLWASPGDQAQVRSEPTLSSPRAAPPTTKLSKAKVAPAAAQQTPEVVASEPISAVATAQTSNANHVWARQLLALGFPVTEIQAFSRVERPTLERWAIRIAPAHRKPVAEIQWGFESESSEQASAPA